MKTLNVIMSAYNAEQTIEKCINSILNQTYSDFDLFVFDDCSTDNTLNILKSFKDKRLTIIASKQNIGTYAAKNFIVKNFCDACYIALHDADDYSEQERFTKQVLYLSMHPHVHCLGTAVREFWNDDSIRPHTIASKTFERNSRINTYYKLLTRSDLKEVILYLENDDLYSQFLRFKFCMNGTVMFTKQILDKLGGWDDVRMGADTDLFIRILANHEIHNIEECLYNRFFHKDSLTTSEEYGIKSQKREKYGKARKFVVKDALNGIDIVRDFEYPNSFDYEVIKCVE